MERPWNKNSMNRYFVNIILRIISLKSDENKGFQSETRNLFIVNKSGSDCEIPWGGGGKGGKFLILTSKVH